MTVLNAEVVRQTNHFCWTIQNNRVKPLQLRKIEDDIAQKSAKFIRLVNVVPLPVNELDELDDEIKHLQKIKERLLDEWKERSKS
jgi:hypothetical protein